MSFSSSRETPRTLESVEEVAEVLQSALRYGSERLTNSNQPIRISYNFSSHASETVPDAANKGLIVRTDELHALEDINIPGMTPDEAIELALDRLCGERREIPADATRRNTYNVELAWITAQPSGMRFLPTLLIGKVDRLPEALAPLMVACRDILDEPNRPQITKKKTDMTLDQALSAPLRNLEAAAVLLDEGEYFVDDKGRAHVGHGGQVAFQRQQNRLLPVTQKQVGEGLLKMEGDSKKPPEESEFAIWMGGLTDMSVGTNAHALVLPEPGLKLHLIELPFASDTRKDSKSNPVDARKIQGNTAKNVAAVAG